MENLTISCAKFLNSNKYRKNGYSVSQEIHVSLFLPLPISQNEKQEIGWSLKGQFLTAYLSAMSFLFPFSLFYSETFLSFMYKMYAI